MSDKHYVHAPETTKLEELLKQVKPWFERYATALIYLVSAVIFGIAVLVWMNRGPAAGSETTQLLLTATRNQELETFRDLADNNSDSEIGIWARVRQADLMLRDAMQKMYTYRKDAQEELEAALTAYENLENRTDLPSLARQRVLVGLARITEAQCDGSQASIKSAVDAWQRILDEYQDSAVFESLAEERIEQLSLESTAEFYAWFQQQNPSPDVNLAPQDGAGTPPSQPESGGLLNNTDFDSLLRTDPGQLAPETDPPALPANTPSDPSATTDDPAAGTDGAAEGGAGNGDASSEGDAATSGDAAGAESSSDGAGDESDE